MRTLVIVLLLAACKRYETPKQLDEKCSKHRDCADGLACLEGLRATKVCMKPCGPTAAQPDIAVDTSCPAGWSCKALHTTTLTMTDGSKRAAFGGLTDRPVCVPDDWKGS